MQYKRPINFNRISFFFQGFFRVLVFHIKIMIEIPLGFSYIYYFKFQVGLSLIGDGYGIENGVPI